MYFNDEKLHDHSVSLPRHYSKIIFFFKVGVIVAPIYTDNRSFFHQGRCNGLRDFATQNRFYVFVFVVLTEVVWRFAVEPALR